MDWRSRFYNDIYLGFDLWVKASIRLWKTFRDITDMTLADEDTNSILADNDNKAIQGNVAMQAAPLDVQMLNQCKWHHVVTTFGSNASGAT